MTTLYTILFAAVAGNAINMMASFILKRGARIQLLEQLYGSTTIAATVRTQLLLRPYNLIAIILIAFWSLSPLGGQGTLRLLTVQHNKDAYQRPIYLLDTNQQSGIIQHPGYHITGINGVYVSSLIASNVSQGSPQDAWGNIKIPWIDNIIATKSDGWGVLPNSSLSYSSLVGIPIANLSTTGTSNFLMSSSYFTLDCPEGPELIPMEQEIQWFVNGTATVIGNQKPINGSGYSRYLKAGGTATTWSLGSLTPANPEEDPPNLFFQFDTGTAGGGTTNITALNCFVYNNLVDSRVECEGSVCQVVGMRSAPSANHTLTARAFSSRHISGFYTFFTEASGIRQSLAKYSSSSLLEQYAYFGYSPIGATNAQLPKNLSTVSGKLLAERLGQLLNTYWIPMLEPLIVTGQFPSKDELLNYSTSITVDQQGVQRTFAVSGAESIGLTLNTTATVSEQYEVFVCDKRWLIILLVSAIALLACVLAGLVLKYFSTSAPDVVGYVSSLTRDNPYVASIVPAGGSTLDGFDRARLLKNVRIKLADARGMDPASGYVAVVPADQVSTSLNSHRRYL